MNDFSLHQLLSIYIWFGLSALLFLLALIARFYERLSGEHTYYRLLAVPAVLFSVALLRLAGLDRLVGDTWGDVLLLVGGASLTALCLHVYHLMTSGR